MWGALVPCLLILVTLFSDVLYLTTFNKFKPAGKRPWIFHFPLLCMLDHFTLLRVFISVLYCDIIFESSILALFVMLTLQLLLFQPWLLFSFGLIFSALFYYLRVGLRALNLLHTHTHIKIPHFAICTLG